MRDLQRPILQIVIQRILQAETERSDPVIGSSLVHIHRDPVSVPYRQSISAHEQGAIQYQGLPAGHLLAVGVPDRHLSSAQISVDPTGLQRNRQVWGSGLKFKPDIGQFAAPPAGGRPLIGSGLSKGIGLIGAAEYVRKVDRACSEVVIKGCIGAKGKGPRIPSISLSIVHRHIIPVTRGERVDLEYPDPLSDIGRGTGHLVQCFIHDHHLLPVHGTVNRAGLHLHTEGGRRCYKSEPDILVIASAPTSSAFRLGGGRRVAESCVRGAPSCRIGDLEGPLGILVINGIVNAKRKGSRGTVVIHGDIIPVTNGHTGW